MARNWISSTVKLLEFSLPLLLLIVLETRLFYTPSFIVMGPGVLRCTSLCHLCRGAVWYAHVRAFLSALLSHSLYHLLSELPAPPRSSLSGPRSYISVGSALCALWPHPPCKTYALSACPLTASSRRNPLQRWDVLSSHICM